MGLAEHLGHERAHEVAVLPRVGLPARGGIGGRLRDEGEEHPVLDAGAGVDGPGGWGQAPWNLVLPSMRGAGRTPSRASL